MASSTLVDNVSVYATSTGTGAIGLGAAVLGYRGREALIDGATYSYAIKQDGQYENGRGTYLASSSQLIRTPLFSSNGNSAVSLEPNALVSFVVLAEDIVVQTVVPPLSGFIAPGATMGGIGDFYYNLSQPVTLYGPKASAGWGVGVSLQGFSGPANSTYDTINKVAAAATTNLSAILTTPAGSTFAFQSGNQSGLVAADPMNAVSIAPSSDPTGASGAWIRQNISYLRLAWFGLAMDGTVSGGGTDDGPKWRAALVLAGYMNIQRITKPVGLSRVASPICSGQSLPPGIRFEDEGHTYQTPYNFSSGIVYTGSGTCWGISYPNYAAIPEIGGWRWECMGFKATDPTASMFSFQDPETQNPSDGGGYSVIQSVQFVGCYGEGAKGGTAQTGDFFKGAKVFALEMDAHTRVTGWRRGVWLKGCDNAVLTMRSEANGRNVMLEAAGTGNGFGNEAVIDSRYLGAPVLTSEPSYCVYDTANKSLHVAPLWEAPAVSGTAVATAMVYLGGLATDIIAPRFNAAGTPAFELGPNANGIVMRHPIATTAGAAAAPIIRAPTSWNLGEVTMDTALTIEGASLNVQTVFGTSARIHYVAPVRGGGSISATMEPMVVTPAGTVPRVNVITGSNYWGKLIDPAVGGVQDILIDAAIGKPAIHLNKATVQAGFAMRLICGNDFAAGPLRIANRMRLATGTDKTGWAMIALKNGAFFSNAFTYLNSGTNYALNVDKLDASGFAPGDTLDILIYRSATAASDVYVEAIAQYSTFATIADLAAQTIGTSATATDAAKQTDVQTAFTNVQGEIAAILSVLRVAGIVS